MLRKAAALLLAAGFCATWPVGALSAHATARLVWDTGTRPMRLKRPPGGATAGSWQAGLLLEIELPGPADSLGFILYWAAPDSGATASFEVAGSGVDTVAAPERLRPILPAITLGPPALEAMQSSSGAGPSSYAIPLRLKARGTDEILVAARRIVARLRTGAKVHLGSARASCGGAWRLGLPAVVSEIRGRLNSRFLESRIVLRGDGLERLAGFLLVGNDGELVGPKRVLDQTNESVTLVFANKRLPRGELDAIVEDVDGLRWTLPRAVVCAPFEERLPGDSNLGVVPGEEDEDER